jgi:SRSO17 transposase
MQLPIVEPAPLVVQHAPIFAHLFENRCQYRHFEHYLTGLMVLENKSLTNIARCVLASADKTNLSRFFSAAPWLAEQVNDTRVAYMVRVTAPHRQGSYPAALLLDDTLCEHVGSLFEHIARHYNHAEDTYPLAHNPITTHFLCGAVRFPVDLREYRRYEELTRWEAFIHDRFPEQVIPRDRKGRTRLHQRIDDILLEDPAFVALHEQFRTKIELAVELIQQALKRQLPFDVVLFDAWFLAPEIVALVTAAHKDWISLLKPNRNLETNSFVLRDADGAPIRLTGPHIQVKDLLPLIPASAYRPLTLDGQTYWTFTLAVRVPSLGKVRLIISFAQPDLTGSYVVLVTNRVDWNAKQIIATYLLRWPIETFYQDSKQCLGLDEYRMRSAEAIQKHWCLVFAAYSFLHLDCLPLSPVKALAMPVKTIGQAARQQAQLLIQALICFAHEQLTQGHSAQEVFAYLFAKQGAVLTT